MTMTRRARKTRFLAQTTTMTLNAQLDSRVGVSPSAKDAEPWLGRGGVVESVGARIPVEPRRRASPPSDSGAQITTNCATLPAREQWNGERGGCLARRRYQVGTLILRGKTWHGRWREDVIGPDGKVQRVRRCQAIGTLAELPTKKLAHRRLELLLARVNAPGYRPGRTATLAEFSERWRADVLSQRKPSTVRAAESHLQVHILPHLGAMRLDQLMPENQQAFVACLSKRHAAKTVLNVLGTLSAMLNTAKKWGYVCEGMELRTLALPARGEKAQAHFFTAQEVRAIVAAAKEPYSTMFGVAAMTGMRCGEIFGLKVEDLDFRARVIYVRRSVWYGKLQAPKSSASVRTLPMPEPLAQRLEAYLRTWRPNPERLLFATRPGRPVSANNVVQRKLWPILDKLGIPRCGLHAFRHTHCSLLVGMGAPPTVAQAQLGHSDPRITLGIYSHVIGDSQRQAVEKLAGLLDPFGLTPEVKGEWVQ